jgi:hypothetical protein
MYFAILELKIWKYGAASLKSAMHSCGPDLARIGAESLTGCAK